MCGTGPKATNNGRQAPQLNKPSDRISILIGSLNSKIWRTCATTVCAKNGQAVWPRSFENLDIVSDYQAFVRFEHSLTATVLLLGGDQKKYPSGRRRAGAIR